MIDIDLIRQQPDLVKKKLRERGLTIDIAAFLEEDKRYRELLGQVETLRADRNLKVTAAKDDPNARTQMKTMKVELSKKEAALEPLKRSLEEKLSGIPNMHADQVPIGKDETGNVVLHEVGERTAFKFPPRPYDQVAVALDLIDTEKASAVAGTRFAYIKNDLVFLEFALIQHAMKKLTARGFIPILPPMMIRPEVYQGMGRLAGEQKEERYYLEPDDLYLIGSAEHTLGPLHLNETLEEKALPKRYVGFSSCFRREAGSYGKDTKGILRLHQFDKVEMFVFSTPERSDEEHQALLANQEELMQDLKLPYRVVEICTGDIGWTDARQYDIEAWFPAQQKYRETHSCSNTSDFQARGISARYRSERKTSYLHMLNATAYAMSRTPAAIIENYQQADGTIAIPEILRPYLPGMEVIGCRAG